MEDVWILGFGRVGHLVFSYEQSIHSKISVITKSGGERSFQNDSLVIPTQREFPKPNPSRIWICVPESEFQIVISRLIARLPQVKLAIQTSGWLSPSLLLPICDANSDVLSFHPMKSILPHCTSLENTLVTLCGTARGVQFGKRVAESLKANHITISEEEKKPLHLLSQFASNIPYAILAAIEDLSLKTNIPTEQLVQVVRSMIIDSVDAAIQFQPKQAVTGLVARGDWSSIEESIQFLSEKPFLANFYRGYVQYLTHYLLSKGASIEKMQQWQTILTKMEVKNVSSVMD